MKTQSDRMLRSGAYTVNSTEEKAGAGSDFGHHTNLTPADRERIAYVTGDTKTLAVFDWLELDTVEALEQEVKRREAIDDRTDSDTLISQSQQIQAFEESWETLTKCITHVTQSLRTGKSLSQRRMRELAGAFDGLLARVPTGEQEEHDFSSHIDRICGAARLCRLGPNVSASPVVGGAALAPSIQTQVPKR